MTTVMITQDSLVRPPSLNATISKSQRFVMNATASPSPSLNTTIFKSSGLISYGTPRCTDTANTSERINNVGNNNYFHTKFFLIKLAKIIPKIHF